MRKARLLKGWKLYLALILFSYPLLFAIMWTEARWRLRQPHPSLAAIAAIAAAGAVILVAWTYVGTSRRDHSN
jgi:hypothetical protein